MNNICIIYIFLISFGIGIIKCNFKKITNIIKNRNLKYNLIQQDDDNNYKLFNTDEFELNNYITENGINNQNDSSIINLIKEIGKTAFGFDAFVMENFSIIFLGVAIVVILIVEPHGLARLCQITKQKLRLWPFPY